MKTIEQAIQTLGSARALAQAVGVSPQAVSLWRRGGTQLLAAHAALIEDRTGGRVTAYAIGTECRTRSQPEPD